MQNTTTLPIIGERQGDVTVGEFPLGTPLTMDIKGTYLDLVGCE